MTIARKNKRNLAAMIVLLLAIIVGSSMPLFMNSARAETIFPEPEDGKYYYIDVEFPSEFYYIQLGGDHTLSAGVGADKPAFLRMVELKFFKPDVVAIGELNFKWNGIVGYNGTLQGNPCFIFPEKMTWFTTKEVFTIMKDTNFNCYITVMPNESGGYSVWGKKPWLNWAKTPQWWVVNKKFKVFDLPYVLRAEDFKDPTVPWTGGVSGDVDDGKEPTPPPDRTKNVWKYILEVLVGGHGILLQILGWIIVVIILGIVGSIIKFIVGLFKR